MSKISLDLIGEDRNLRKIAEPFFVPLGFRYETKPLWTLQEYSERLRDAKTSDVFDVDVDGLYRSAVSFRFFPALFYLDSLVLVFERAKSEFADRIVKEEISKMSHMLTAIKIATERSIWENLFIFGDSVFDGLDKKARLEFAKHENIPSLYRDIMKKYKEESVLLRSKIIPLDVLSMIKVEIPALQTNVLDPSTCPKPFVQFTRSRSIDRQWYVLGCHIDDVSMILGWFRSIPTQWIGRNIVAEQIGIRDMTFVIQNEAMDPRLEVPLWQKSIIDQGRKMILCAVEKSVFDRAGYSMSAALNIDVVMNKLMPTGQRQIQEIAQLPPLPEKKQKLDVVEMDVVGNKCPDGNSCILFHDRDHMTKYVHPHIGEVCPGTPFACKDKSQKHLSQFVHVCPDGSDCKIIDNVEHVKKSIHVAMTCNNGSACMDTRSEHRMMRHGVVRELCPDRWCWNTDPRHIANFMHGPPSIQTTSFDSLNTKPEFIDFEGNVNGWFDRLYG